MFEVKRGAKPLIVILATISFLFAGESSFPQENNSRNVQRKPSYRIGQEEYAGANEKLLLLFISINAKHLNSNDMISLANQLKLNYASEEQIQVSFFTNHKSAKTFSLNSGSPNYSRNMEALAASYYLNRRTGEEYVSFSPEGYLPRQTQRINLGEKPIER